MATDTKQDRSRFSLKIDKDKLTIQESYNLVTTTVGEYPSLAGLPAIQSVHPVYSSAVCESIDIVPTSENNRVFYAALVNYSTPEGSNGTSTKTKFNFDVGVAQVEFDRDKDGNPILASSGEPPQSNLLKNMPVIVLNASKAYTSLDIATWSSYVGKLNNSTWTPSSGLLSFPENTVQCIGISLDDFDVDSNYYLVKWKFLYEEDEHKIEILDKGFQYWSTAIGRAVWSHENIDKEPRLLNGYGNLFGETPSMASTPMGQPAGSTVVHLPSTGTPTGTYLRWNIYNTDDFSALSL